MRHGWMSRGFARMARSYTWRSASVVLGGVLEHVGEHVADVVVGGGVQDPPLLALAADQARPAQQPQVVADQWLRSADAQGDVAHRDRAVHARKQYPQPGGVAQQPVGGGDGLNAPVAAATGIAGGGWRAVSGRAARLRGSAPGAGAVPSAHAGDDSTSTSTVAWPMP